MEEKGQYSGNGLQYFWYCYSSITVITTRSMLPPLTTLVEGLNEFKLYYHHWFYVYDVGSQLYAKAQFEAGSSYIYCRL